MSRHNVEQRAPLTLMELPDAESGEGSAASNGSAMTNGSAVSNGSTGPGPDGGLEPLRRHELGLQSLAEELAEALLHLERATLAAKGTGFTARVRDALEDLDRLQRSAAEEFGRKVGDRMGREALWRQRRGIDVD